MMMKRIANRLIGLACLINPTLRLRSIERVDHYVAKRLGICLLITKKEIKNYRKNKKFYEGLSNRKADEKIVNEVKNEVRASIIRAIDDNNLIEYLVQKVGDEMHVTGELKVYIKERIV